MENADGLPFGGFSVANGARTLSAAGVEYHREAGEALLTLSERLDPEQPCFVEADGVRVPAEPLGIYDTAEFVQAYATDGRLGADYASDRTVFRLWSPFAFSVVLNLFERGDGGEPSERIRMTRGEKGVWSATALGDREGDYYTFTLALAAGEVESADPYAVSFGLNGERGMVTDLRASAVTPSGWAGEHAAFKSAHPLASYTDAVVWEVHTRDFSGKTDAVHRNGFLAFTESGLKNKSGLSVGLDYIADLGVTHVHLLPAAEYATVDARRLNDETYNAFNWGYDPKNYFSPMGAYSTDPSDGHARVSELRQAVASLHARGIGVVFDVVFNHTYDQTAPLARTVPYYFYRHDRHGNLTNGSGCGNETASERAMCRRFMLDCLRFWQDEYHADGFRFDLMGLHDVTTMTEIERALHAVDPSALIYGEGWVGGPTALDEHRQCNKWNSGGIRPSAGAAGGVAVFSDVMRDSVKGAVFREQEGGYVNGRAYENVNLVKFSSMGGTSPNFETNWVAPSAAQVVNYVSAHDNNTLWDKLCLTCGNYKEADRARMNRMCAAIVLTSRGIPFFQAGEEFLRSKPKPGGGFVENSYNAPDGVNNIDWESLTVGSAQERTRDYYKGLIAFRKAHPTLRLSDTDEIEAATDFINTRYDVITYTLAACGEQLLIVYNPLDGIEIDLPSGKWSLRVTGDVAGDIDLGIFEGRITVPYKSVYCLVRIE